MKKTPANFDRHKEPSRGELAEHFRKTVELSKAAYRNDPTVDLNAPMNKTIRRITWEEKNAEHFAFHREFYERERSK
ncbi:MAG: hypothetical protein JST61_02930 [Acidobacteria bacterium]|nr:hypothetical protein [Acidobacteriota bacterium]